MKIAFFYFLMCFTSCFLHLIFVNGTISLTKFCFCFVYFLLLTCIFMVGDSKICLFLLISFFFPLTSHTFICAAFSSFWCLNTDMRTFVWNEWWWIKQISIETPEELLVNPFHFKTRFSVSLKINEVKTRWFKLFGVLWIPHQRKNI